MTREQIEAAVRSSLGAIAPEVDLARVRPNADLRDELDIDSMDFLRFVVDVHARLGVDVPEKDYPKLATLRGCVDYLTSACSAGRPT